MLEMFVQKCIFLVQAVGFYLVLWVEEEQVEKIKKDLYVLYRQRYMYINLIRYRVRGLDIESKENMLIIQFRYILKYY